MRNPSYHSIIVSCEHAGFLVPNSYSSLFSGNQKILHTHRGWDPGALKLATIISMTLDAPLLSHIYTRLLIEPNRSAGHRSLFSEFTRGLSAGEKEELINNFYKPYRTEVIQKIESELARYDRVLHLSIHTFTPVLNNNVRNFEIGLLYDPGRESEKKFCTLWKQSLRKIKPEFRIRMNRPYLGKSDGMTSFLRKRFPVDKYAGIELEVNQGLYHKGEADWNVICHEIAQSLKAIKETSHFGLE